MMKIKKSGSDHLNKTLLIIGAGPNQVPAIKMAKARGYFVAVTDMNPDAEGFSLADRFEVISTLDVKNSIKFAKRLYAEMGLDGVMTMASESSVTVAEVAKALGLPGLEPSAAKRASHKVERQKCFELYGIPAPRFAGAVNEKEALCVADKIGWPVVVKPVDRAGSRGVRKVCDSSEMSEAVDEIRSYSNEPEFLIEEFLAGTEHSIEGMVMEGKVYWTGFSDRNYSKKEIYPPYFLEDGDTLPTVLSSNVKKEVFDISTKAVKDLGITWGPAKGDILIDEEGPKILEMAARLSGDYFCCETVPLHNGVNLLAAVMDSSTGINISPGDLKPKYNRGVALRYLWPKPGRVKAIGGIDEVKSTSGVHFFKWEPLWKDLNIGTEIRPARSMGERVGCVMACASTREEAVKIAEKAISTIKIETE